MATATGISMPAGTQSPAVGSPQASGPLPTLPLDGTVVKMKGLPFKANKEDIVKFFGGFSLRSCYLRRHGDGRPNGEAFVVFENSDEARRATTKDRETFGDKFGDRYVRVYPTLESDAADMQQAVAQQDLPHPQGSSHSHVHSDSVVKIKSLPFDATQLDIIQFFQEYKLKPNGVQLVVRSDNKPTGEAFVDFETPEEAVRSIKEKDHKVFSEKFGDRYVRLIQVSRKEMQATLALRFGGEGVLKMKGIPFKAAAVDVRKFFAGYKIKPEGISFIMHADGRPTGMAFIEFETPQEAVRAMEKDRAKFGPEYGDRFCMLQLVGRHEMEKVQLQRESENSAKSLLAQMAQVQGLAATTNDAYNAWMAQINARTLGGNPPTLQQLQMMAAAAPWLPMYQGLVNAGGNPSAAALANSQLPMSGGAPAGGPMLDPSALASHYNGHLGPQGGPANLPALNSGMSALSLLQHQQQQAGAAGSDAAGNGWPMDPTGAGNPLLFYQNQAALAADPTRLGLAGLGMSATGSSVASHTLGPTGQSTHMPSALGSKAPLLPQTSPLVAPLGRPPMMPPTPLYPTPPTAQPLAHPASAVPPAALAGLHAALPAVVAGFIPPEDAVALYPAAGASAL